LSKAFGGLAWPEMARRAQARLLFGGGARRGKMEKGESVVEAK